MNEQNEDFNDLMFEIDDQPQRHDVASIDTDRGIASSISNTGIDRDDPDENRRYIQQNQDPQAIVQGIGVGDVQSDPHSESGLATSISQTRSSEVVPEVIEYQREDSSRNTDELASIIEPEPGPSSGVRYGYDPKYDESVKLAENLEQLDLLEARSAFDIALTRGYRDQAQIAYDDATSRGDQIKTKHIQTIKGLTQELQRDLLDEDYWAKDYVFQRIYMLKKDFKEYLDNIKNNKHKIVLQRLQYKKELTTIEIQIKKNIKSKENRSHLKRDTIRIIENYIEKLEELEKFIRQIGHGNKDMNVPK